MIAPSYRTRIHQLFPTLDLQDATTNEEGLVNDIVIANDGDGQRVFRFPKTAWARTALQHEVRVVNLARRHVRLPLPDFEIVEADVVSYPYLRGEPLRWDDIAAWEPQHQADVAAALGEFLHALHGIPNAELDAHEIAVSETVRSIDDYLQLYADIQDELFPLLMADARTWVERVFAPVHADSSFLDHTPVCINGDLAAYHILHAPNTRCISGIIDFGTAGRGDPATDVSCLINAYGESFLHRMADTYPAIRDKLDRARFYAATLELQWMLGGVRSGDLSGFGVHIGRARDLRPMT